MTKVPKTWMLASLVLFSSLRAQETTTRHCLREPFISFVFELRVITMDVPPDQIKESPKWDIESGDEPPLPPSQALRLASAEFLRTVSKPERWMFTGISVQPLCDKRAVYSVHWSEQGTSGHMSDVMVPVLMSGVVISTAEAIAAAKGANP